MPAEIEIMERKARGRARCRALLRHGVLVFAFAVACLRSTASAEDVSAKPETGPLVVYAYDSIMGPNGIGTYLQQQFHKNSGMTVTIMPSGNSKQLLNRVLIEKKHPKADMVLGIDAWDVERIKTENPNLFVPYKSFYLAEIAPNLLIDNTYTFIPFDYAPFAFIYNSDKIKKPYASMDDMFLDVTMAKKVIIEDPRTSSPGFGLLVWSQLVFGPEFAQKWGAFSKNILTIPSGWDTAYGMFLKGEAPIVFGYLTSIAYHREKEKATPYRAMLFKDGHLLQIECAAVLKSSRNRKTAEAFVDFLLSRETQEAIPLKNWMFPANAKARLPESFQSLRLPTKSLIPKTGITEKNRQDWIKTWLTAIRN